MRATLARSLYESVDIAWGIEIIYDVSRLI